MVEFLTAWNGTATGARVELGAVEEARLIAAGIARAYTTGQEKGPGTDLTDAEEAWVRSSVSGALDSTTALSRLKKLGVRPDSAATLTAQNTWLGANFDHVIGFAEQSSAANPWAQNLTDTQSFAATFAGSDIKWAVPICTGVEPISQTIAGTHDAVITAIAQAIADATEFAFIDVRLGWEPNFSTSYPWGSTIVTTAEYIAAFRKVAALFRAVDKRFVIGFCPSTRVDTAWPFEDMYPGDDYVDVVGVDAYLLSGDKGAMTDREHVEFMFSGPCGINRVRDFAESHGKRMAVCEWGMNYDNPLYVDRMADFIRSNDVAYHTYWDQNNGAFQCKLSGDQWPNSAYAFVRQFGPFHIDTWGIASAPGVELKGVISGSKPITRIEVVDGEANVSGVTLVAYPQASGTRRVTVKAYDERGLTASRSIVLTWQAGRLWTPAELGASLGDWLSSDLSRGVQRHILAVKSMTSMLGATRVATAQTAGQRPTFGYTSGVPHATLDGGDALLQTVITGVPAAQAACTYAAMLYTDPAAGNFTYWVMDSDAGAAVRGVGVNGGNLRMASTGGVAGGAVTGLHGITVSYGAGASAAVRGVIDGGTATTGTVAIGAATYTRRVLGANAGAGSTIGSYYLGRLYEFFCATVAMSTGQEEQSHGYLAWKYGLEANLPGGHVYKNAPPAV